jgi:4-hydroxy-tetrahydrodipicolinate reductase
MLKLAISGASGRVGQYLLDAASRDASVEVSGAFVPPASKHVGSAVHGVVLHEDAAVAIASADVLIDFTRPSGTLDYLALCAKHKTNAVVGTTGFSADERAQIHAYAKEIAIVFAPNMALGVNVTAKLVEIAAKSLGMDADIEVFEAHHKLKVDAPSGTALMLGDVAARARGQRLADVSEVSRHGHTGERKAGTIGFSSVRAGDIVGDHTVYFALNGERIEITHRSASRATYADGAIRAAKFLADKSSGMFDMHDVLGMKS